MTKPTSTSDADLSELLLKALDSLPAEERRQVLSALIQRGLAATSPQTMMPALLPSTSAFFGASTLAAPGAARLVPLPVRLPANDYERLKAWSARHEFPMAVVIRGLVERFLDGQQDEPPPD